MIHPTRRGGSGGSGCRCRGVRRLVVTPMMTRGYDRLRVYLSRPSLIETSLNKPFPYGIVRCASALPPPPLPLAIPLQFPTGHLVSENGIRLYTIPAAQEKTPTPLQG
jgi:hypothetical protein